MIKIQEIGRFIQIEKMATISLNNITTFVTGGGYAADMEIEVFYKDIGFDEDYGDFSYKFNGLTGHMRIFKVIDNYIVRYAEGRGFFQIEHIGYDTNTQEFTVTYFTRK